MSPRFLSRLWAGSEFSLRSYSLLSVPIDFEWGKWCLHLFSVTMHSVFIKLTGNKDRHKISDEFEFSVISDQSFWSYVHLIAEKMMSSFSQSSLIGSLSNLEVTRTGIKARMSSNLGRVGLFIRP